jgi:hypothetical protein
VRKDYILLTVGVDHHVSCRVRMNDDAGLRVEYVKLPACDGRAAEAGE